jgi:excisionase family DNA binding protein
MASSRERGADRADPEASPSERADFAAVRSEVPRGGHRKLGMAPTPTGNARAEPVAGEGRVGASRLAVGMVLLTADETASLLRTSRKAVYAMAERAQLPGVTRIGRRLLVRRDDLLSWLDERRAASPGGTRR